MKHHVSIFKKQGEDLPGEQIPAVVDGMSRLARRAFVEHGATAGGPQAPVKESLREVAYSTLKAAITKSHYHRGPFLNVSMLANELELPASVRPSLIRLKTSYIFRPRRSE